LENWAPGSTLPQCGKEGVVLSDCIFVTLNVNDYDDYGLAGFIYFSNKFFVFRIIYK